MTYRLESWTLIKISVIIVSWNAKDYLIKCLKSVQKEAREVDCEIIVVDNGSTDGSVQAVRRLFPNVVLIESRKNLGFAKANNIGIKRCRGEYIFLVNSDVIILESAITKIINFLESHKTVGMLGPKVLNGDQTLQLSCRKKPTLTRFFLRAIGLEHLFKTISYHSHQGLEEVDILSGCFWAIRREALDEVGLLDEQFFFCAEDKDWSIRFKQNNWKVVYYPEASIIHYEGASSSNMPVYYYVEMLKANIKLWKKYHSIPSIFIYYILNIYYHLIRIISNWILSLFQNNESKSSSLHKIERSREALKYLLNSRSKNNYLRSKTEVKDVP